MKIQLAGVAALIFLSAIRSEAQQKPLRLWYKAPARQWEGCVPLGNGRLGAMPDGGVDSEQVVLNDISLWSGGVQDADKPGAAAHLAEIQHLIFEGKNIEAQEVMSRYFVSQGAGSGSGNGADVPYGSYQVLGDLHLRYAYDGYDGGKDAAEYCRQLSLEDAVASTSLRVGGTKYTREYFTSLDDDVVIIRLSASRAHAISCSLGMRRPERFETLVQGQELQMRGRLNNGTDGKGMQYMVRVVIKAEGGTVVAGRNSLELKHADAAVIYISAGTDYKNPGYRETTAALLKKVMAKPYAVERARHIAKYRKLFERATLRLGDTGGRDSLPTDERLEAFARDVVGGQTGDNGLAALYFQYGRYLLISSTRPGYLPPNLQGLWSNTIGTPWNGDYHLNINIQMNHWPLDVTNLGMLNGPFFDLVKGLVAPGEKTARTYYNGNGWVAHVITNIWGYTSPGEDYSWGSFNTGSAWMCQDLWSHYTFSKDTVYLRRLYPILKGSAAFYLSTLVKEPTHGWLVTAPSNSPENAFLMPDGRDAHVTAGPTIDNQIIRYLFAATIEAGRALRKDAVFGDSLRIAMALLPPDQIGGDGRLLEWLKEYKEQDPHHRHVSHLWGLYPGDEINMNTPELAKAARATLEGRGDEGTGWSLAWKINFWARLHDGDRAFLVLGKLLRPVMTDKVNMHSGGGSYANLFCAHPPFQIDGNFGGTAGIAEMLVQSQGGYIELLPALPAAWREGRFTGLCVRGGAEVDAEWKSGAVQRARIRARADNVFRLKVPENMVLSGVRRNGRPVTVRAVDGFLSLSLKKGEEVEIGL